MYVMSLNLMGFADIFHIQGYASFPKIRKNRIAVQTSLLGEAPLHALPRGPIFTAYP